MNTLDDFFQTQPPSASRPLLGLTVLAVEDSRFACEAIRLMCVRSGARIRRADCIASARRHLRVYRPAVAIIDMGLPDGSGTDLITDLSNGDLHKPVVLATSGDADLEPDALAAGAAGFLRKPMTSVAAFQAEVLRHLPAERRPNAPRAADQTQIAPDRIAFQDDLTAALTALDGQTADANQVAYVANFVQGVARCAEDADLFSAARAASFDPSRAGPANAMLGLLRERAQHRIAV